MTFLNTILETEEGAKQQISDAHNEARTRISDAEAKSQKELDQLKHTLASDRAQKVESQEEELKELYSSILEKGKKEAATVKEKATSNVAGSVAKVLDAIS